MKNVYIEILDEVAIDPRLKTGIFDVSNNEHLSIYREYLINSGISENHAIGASNILAEAGKFPERQAYNKDGLLVTFTSPEHKQRALARGSHFEQNPKKDQVNIFANPQAPTQAPVPGQTPAPAPAPATAPVATQQPTQPDIDTRTPEQKQNDAAAIDKMLKSEYTLKEALDFGFYCKENVWYDSDGKRMGKLWYIDNTGKQIIS